MSRPDLLVAGGVLVIGGDMLGTVRNAVLGAQLSRRKNGAPESVRYRELLCAITEAMSATGRADVRAAPDMPPSSHEPTVTTTDAARRLGCSVRHCRRMASSLGGRKLGGRWLLDELAVTEYHTRTQT